MLTDLKIRTAKPTDKAYRLVDGQGLYLHVTPPGGKHRRLRYQIAGKEKLVAIGPYPAISLADARSRRDQAKALLREGRDPCLEKKLRRLARVESSAQTFETLLACAWHVRSAPHWTERHADDVMRSLERDVFGPIGNIPVSEITGPIVLFVLLEIEK